MNPVLLKPRWRAFETPPEPVPDVPPQFERRIDPDSLSDLLGEVARVREAAFALTDAARGLFGHEHTGVHVHLQTAANELGELERLLDATRT